MSTSCGPRCKSHVWPAARPIHRRLAEDIDPLPCVKRSPDPTDDFLLAPSEAGNADAEPDEIQRIVDEAVSEVRAERRAKGKADKA